MLNQDYAGQPVVSLAIDTWDGSPPQVQTFRSSGITFPILMQGTANGVRTDYDCTFHIYFVIGGDGVITYRGSWRDAAIRTAVDDAIAALVVSGTGDTPAANHLLAAPYPNPFNPRTSIPFDLAGDGGDVEVRLEILDLRGRLVRTVLDGARPGGRRHVAAWDGTDGAGRPMPSGVYLARLTADGVVRSRLVTMVK